MCGPACRAGNGATIVINALLSLLLGASVSISHARTLPSASSKIVPQIPIDSPFLAPSPGRFDYLVST